MAMTRTREQSPQLTRQVVVIHLSDLHFGKTHRFNPPRAANGDEPCEIAFPTLLSKLKEDLRGDDPGCPVVICITGDIAETGDIEEFSRAEEFIRGIAEAEIFGRARGIESVFIVPGNHDVKNDSDEIGVRWQQWTEFFNRIYGSSIRREAPWDFARLYDREKESGVFVLAVNSCIYLQKGKDDADRGRLDVKQLTMIEQALESVDQKKLASAIRIALVHHHPVLIPALAEPGRGYDAIHNSGKLLTILRRYGFHMILHGHKHNPHTFTDDVKAAYQQLPDHPIFISAGGSIGSTGIPQFPRCPNSYNQIVVKWHPEGGQTRVRVQTKELATFQEDGTEKLPTRWDWRTLRVDDRHFFASEHVPRPGRHGEREFNPEVDGKFDRQRTAEYQRTRGNMAVVQVLPSLVPDQAYEAILWLVPHPFGVAKRKDEIPEEVTWSAGHRFEIISVRKEDDPNYTACLSYWGPMLVQARMKFADGYEAVTHVYARMPSVYHAEQAHP